MLINAAICGVFSGTFTRYEGRIVWLAPLTAGLVACVLVPHRAIAAAAAWLAAMEAKLRALAEGAKLPGWAEPIAARVRAHPLGRRIDAQFLKFACVGVLGLTVDYGVLLGLTGLAQFNPYLGRVLSFAVAMTSTWIVNRSWTFREHARDDRRGEEVTTYFAVQCAAGVLNLAVYNALHPRRAPVRPRHTAVPAGVRRRGGGDGRELPGRALSRLPAAAGADAGGVRRARDLHSRSVLPGRRAAKAACRPGTQLPHWTHPRRSRALRRAMRHAPCSWARGSVKHRVGAARLGGLGLRRRGRLAGLDGRGRVLSRCLVPLPFVRAELVVGDRRAGHAVGAACVAR